MHADQLLRTDSFAGLMALLAHHQPGDPPLVIANSSHNDIYRFVARLKATCGLLTDFDGTAHPGNQWAAVRRLMSPESVAAELADLQAYFGRETHDNIQDVALILRSAERMRGISAQAFYDLMPSLPPRPGAMELIHGFNSSQVAFSSFGTHDLIRGWLTCHASGRRDLSQVSIFALQLFWKRAPEGHVIDGCRPETVVSDGNKGYIRDLFCAQRGIKPSELLVLGDAPTDVLMMDPESVGVLVIPKVDPDPGRMAFRMKGLERLWSRVSAVYVAGQDGSLELLHELRTR